MFSQCFNVECAKFNSIKVLKPQRTDIYVMVAQTMQLNTYWKTRQRLRHRVNITQVIVL